MLMNEGNNSWNMFINFIGDVEYLKLTGNYSTTSNGNLLFRQDADNLLSRSETVDEKLKTWNKWHELLMPFTNKFSNNIQLIRKAAIDNGEKDVTEYWEMLSEYQDGYIIAKKKWQEISSLHDKIVNFVKMRLKKKYGNFIEENTLPPHLLGSLQGYDWIPLALDIIPQTSIIYEIRKNLLEKDLVGKNLYISASRLANLTLKHLPEAKFFNESDFQGQCPAKLINLCHKGRMRVSTCSHSSLTNYLSAHKNIAKVLIHQMSEESNPILNFANRYSALEEGVAELFGILSTSNSWLCSLNLLNETNDIEDTRIVLLMITALDVLPRLAYYHSADMWRIDLINNNTLEPKDLINSWWEYRSRYEGITMNSMKLPTFLDDNIIITNRPYLSKFIGIILAFQMYDYLLESTELLFNDIDTIPINHNLIKMIQHGCAENWYEVIKQYLEFYEINVDPLLSYFTPLEQYIDEYKTENDVEVPIEFEKNLEKLEDEFEVNFDNLKTKTTTIKSTTIVNMPNKTIIKPLNVEKDGGHLKELNNLTKIEITSVKPVGNTGIQADSPRTPEKITKPIVNDNGNNINNVNNKVVEEQTVKGTTKAIWAISAILVAIILIIVIALFGRHRCRKAPKNRRYI
ncbi:hypothetical protein PV328_007993 [Microctonus aethiopoides]|nr:hypothetical protein PV328_007993 [Microctonus aethiopoides]